MLCHRNAGGEPQVSLGELKHASWSWKQLLHWIPTYFLTKEVKKNLSGILRKNKQKERKGVLSKSTLFALTQMTLDIHIYMKINKSP